MGTISSTLAINDSMSATLRQIADAVASVTAGLEQMERESESAVNPRDIQQATAALDQMQREIHITVNNYNQMETAIDQATDALDQTERQQEDVNDALRDGQNAASDLWGKIKGFIAAYAGWELVKQTVAWSDEMTNIQARLAQVNDGSRTQDQLMQDIYKNAQNAHASLQGMADIVGRFGNNARDAFSSNDELLAFSNQLYKMFSIAGTDANGAAAAMLQLSQGLGAGVLRGEELNSVFEQAPIIIQTVADYLGVPIGKIREMASEGKLTADVVKNALLNAAEETDAKFAAMPLTFSSAWTMAKNTFQMNMLGLQKVISETINTAQFQQIMDGITSAVSGFASIAIPVVKGVAAAVGFLYRNWSFIAPVIFTVVGAMAIYKAAVIGQMAVEAISKGIKIAGVIASYAKAAATGVEATATTAAAAAQWGLNAAILASPVTWIIAAIAAIIGLLYLAVAVINKVTGANISATGIIAGVIWSLWAYIKNIIATVWNTLLALAEFFMNVWTNPVYSIKKLIYNLLETFTGLFSGIMKGIDPVATALANGILWAVNQGIKAINWLSAALDKIGLGWGEIGELEARASVAADYEGARQAALASINPGEAPEGYKSLDHLKMDFADPQKYAEAGYAAGAKFADDPSGAIKDALGLGGDPAIQAIQKDLADQTKAAQQTAKNTTPKTGEDYQYLKQIMGNRAVDRLAGTDIKIQMNNSNNINSSLDIDNIVNQLSNRLATAMANGAEGSHR